MNKLEILNVVKDTNNNIFCLVGPNTTGKTFTLNFLYEELNSRTLLITEEGLFKTKNKRNKIKLINDTYYYQDESNRGNKERREDEFEVMNQETKNIISKLQKLRFELNSKYLSLGSKKILNILDILLGINLNNIDYILIDEPENSLDDVNLKKVKEVIEILKLNGKKVFFVTHSSRLMELLSLNIDDIYFISKIMGNVYNIKFKEIETLYDECANEIRNIKCFSNITFIDKISCDAPEKFKDLYLNTLLKSEEFYRILFYRKVYLLEGLTEKYILRNNPKLIDLANNVYFLNGKNIAFFFIKILLKLDKEIVCIIDDDDKKEKNKRGFSYYYSIFLEKSFKNEKNVEIFLIPYDLETYLNINIHDILEEIFDTTISGNQENAIIKRYKPYGALYAIKENKCEKNKLNDLFYDNKIYIQKEN